MSERLDRFDQDLGRYCRISKLSLSCLSGSPLVCSSDGCAFSSTKTVALVVGRVCGLRPLRLRLSFGHIRLLSPLFSSTYFRLFLYSLAFNWASLFGAYVTATLFSLTSSTWHSFTLRRMRLGPWLGLRFPSVRCCQLFANVLNHRFCLEVKVSTQ